MTASGTPGSAGVPVEVPVQVMLARRVEALPEADALPGGSVYEPKFDGWRLVVLRTADEVLLQTRNGRMVTATFPEIASAAAALPAGTVLDGEVVVFTGGRVDFSALQHRALGAESPRRRRAPGPPVNLAAFDLLAVSGTDLRPRPYEDRRALLVTLLAPLGPAIQAVPVTYDRAEAAGWYEHLVETGIEGLVVKGRAQSYQPGRRRWLKLRHAAPRDALAVGWTGPRTRPRALVVDLGEGPALSAPLSPTVSRDLAAFTRTGEGAAGVLDDGTRYRSLDRPLPVEVRQGADRHALITVTRLRPA
ncbi:ATP-dependent DNA ligase [Streptomyces cinnamoneus]|nr:ATP-dependent DNA ligase [Streptomyces cinnamoneus]